MQQDHKKSLRHLAIIMDGNRRWAKARGLAAHFGHEAGANRLTDILDEALLAGIECITLFAFSSENWKRSPFEIMMITQIIKKFLKTHTKELLSRGARFHVIGDLTPFDQELKDRIQEACQLTCNGAVCDLVIALNYGARNEIIKASQAMAKDLSLGKLKDACLNEEIFRGYLSTGAFPDPDLVIRTGGRKRLSNFLLWQISYAELYFTETLWPDFSPLELQKALKEYAASERRFGR